MCCEINEIEYIDSNNEEDFYDIEIEDDHTFFINLNDELILSR